MAAFTVLYNDSQYKTFTVESREDITDDLLRQYDIDPDSVDYIFDTDDCIIHKTDTEKDRFETYCRWYDFKPEDYKTRFYDKSGDIFEFIGFKPQNTKYKCIIRNIATNATLKCRIAYIRDCLKYHRVA